MGVATKEQESFLWDRNVLFPNCISVHILVGYCPIVSQVVTIERIWGKGTCDRSFCIVVFFFLQLHVNFQSFQNKEFNFKKKVFKENLFSFSGSPKLDAGKANRCVAGCGPHTYVTAVLTRRARRQLRSENHSQAREPLMEP